MRWFLLLLLAIPIVNAVFVQDSLPVGSNFDLYGSMLAFERDNKIVVYDLDTKLETEISEGSNPSLFGYTLAFERDGEIFHTHVKNVDVKTTGAEGRHPFVYSNFIVFSTSEKDLGVDFSDDSDLNDDIVRMFDISSGKVTNFKAVGDFPIMNKDVLVFNTYEGQIDFDLDSDDSKDDYSVRILDLKTRKVDNTLTSVDGRPGFIDDKYVAYSSKNEIILLDTLSHKLEKTGLAGRNPSGSNSVVVFDNDGSVFGYSFKDKHFARISSGESPVLFGEVLVLLDGKIKVLSDENVDNDEFSDFIDNCPELAGDFEDNDSDGLGDPCDSTPKKKEKQSGNLSESSNASEKPELSAEAESSEDSNFTKYLVYILIILLLPFAVKFGYRYYKKRRKSFGF